VFRETCGAVGFYALLLFETASGPDKLTRLHSHFCVRVVHCSCHSDPSSHRTITLSPVMDAIWTTLRSLLVIGGFLLKRRNSRCEFYANAVDLAPLGGAEPVGIAGHDLAVEHGRLRWRLLISGGSSAAACSRVSSWALPPPSGVRRLAAWLDPQQLSPISQSYLVLRRSRTNVVTVAHASTRTTAAPPTS